MVIRSSSAREIEQLLRDLQDASAVRREAALARLRVLGSRAIARLEQLLKAGSEEDRVSALQALEGIEDPRVVDLAIDSLGAESQAVRLQAVHTLRSWVVREQGTRVMEALVGCALAESQDPDVRAAARDALSQLPGDIIQPILEQAPAQAERAALDPPAVHAWLNAHADAPLSALHAMITQIRTQEPRAGGDAEKIAWVVARGGVHAVLARRGSAVALYDLRETFDRARIPLPLDYLTAVTAIGDAACIEALAKAWSATSPSEVWWRERLADAATAIAGRLKLTRRHTALKRVHARWPGFLH